MKKMMLTACALVLAVGVVTTPDLAGDVHFGLTKSAPEADASVSSLDEVRLWFTQVAQDNSVSIRLVDAEGEAVESPGAERDPEDGKVFSITFEHTPPAGAYTVAWRGIGDDGHVVTGDFGFTIAAN